MIVFSSQHQLAKCSDLASSDMGGISDTVMRTARKLARNCGYAVFPVCERKRPVCRQGFKSGTRDPDAITMLWRRWPGPLIGVATGALSGVDVLDIDVKHDDALHWWVQNEARIASMRTYRTRSGGLHLYFRHAEGVRNSQSRIAQGIDVRGCGGYVIHWFAAGLPCLDNEPPAPWPDWLLRPGLVHPSLVAHAPDTIRSRNIHRAIDSVLRCIAEAQQGARNSTLYWATCRVAERVQAGQIVSCEAEALLIGAARACGLPEPEARATVRSGLRWRAAA